LKIAQRFIAGWAGPSVVPPGLQKKQKKKHAGPAHPAINRWAIFNGPSGTEDRASPRPAPCHKPARPDTLSAKGTMTINLDQIFRRTAHRQPAHPALIGPGEGLSYRGLDDAIAAAADALSRAGLRAGHCVGLHLPSGVDYIVFTYAAWRCGGCVVPVPTEL